VEDARSEEAVSAEDREKILASARDYIEGWLDGDAERMARCLHPALVKREALAVDPSAESMTRDQMIAATRAGRGTKLDRPYEAKILDAFADIAAVSVLSSAYMDYLHVARSGDDWLLLNVLWQRRNPK
jgi:putative lumazine-binding protein